MMIRTLIAALPLVLVLSGCGGSMTAPQEAETTREVSYSSVATDTAYTDDSYTDTTAAVASDTTSLTGGPMGSGS
jgi:ABC-type glycerol-3-phosphate transport system substrate-binding protein